MPLEIVSGSAGEYYRYRPLQPWADAPHVIFLHGGSQRGFHLGPAMAERVGAFIDGIGWSTPVSFPICERGYDAYYGPMEERVLACLEGGPGPHILAGYSMGAGSALYLGARHPGRFAGLLMMAAGVHWQEAGLPRNFPAEPAAVQLFRELFCDPNRAENLAARLHGTRSWFFHGSADRITPASEVEALVECLQARQAPVRFSLYAGVGHDCWAPALEEADLLPWLAGAS
jgi:pimeloyl-ACP methyl ester carboxylesterase